MTTEAERVIYDIFNAIFAIFILTITVAIIAVEECMASAIAGTIDLLHVANRITEAIGKKELPRFDWKIVSVPASRLKQVTA